MGITFTPKGRALLVQIAAEEWAQNPTAAEKVCGILGLDIKEILAEHIAAPAPAQQPRQRVTESDRERAERMVRECRVYEKSPIGSPSGDVVEELAKEFAALRAELAHTSPEPLAEIIRDKTAELEAEGVCKWQYPCPYCLEGNTPIRSSVTDAMVHHTSVGRVLCQPRDKPVSFGVASEPAEPSTPLVEDEDGAPWPPEVQRAILEARFLEHSRSCLYCNQGTPGCNRGRALAARSEAPAAPPTGIIEVKPSPTADTRTCDFANVSKGTLLESSRQHIEDVRAALRYFGAVLNQAAREHDFDKITDIDGFHRDFVTGFKRTEWWDAHRQLNRHHLQEADGVRGDVNLIDVLDFIADCVMAGMARSGSVYELRLRPEILERAFQNTVELLKGVVRLAPAAPKEGK